MNFAEINIDTALVIEDFLLKGKEIKVNAPTEEYLKACHEYCELAKSMPYHEMQDAIKAYDNSKPKMDELEFVKALQTKYAQTKEHVLIRIKYVRKLSNVNWTGNIR